MHKLKWFSSFSRGRSTSWRDGTAAKRRRLQLEALEDRRLLSLSVGHLVWNDLNANGIQEAGEPGVAGVVAELFNSTDSTIGNADDVSCGMTTTNANGNYSFNDLLENTSYFIKFRTPASYSFTAQNAGVDPAFDSDVDSSGVTAMFSLAGGASRTDLDAGLLGSSPVFGYAFRAGGTAYDNSNAIAVDTAGNTYITGNYIGTVDFDPGPGTYNLVAVNSNYPDVFVAKYSSSGALNWARSLGGTSYDYGFGIAVDGAGDVFTVGAFQGTADFDPGASVYNLTVAGNRDLFVSKLDSQGNFLWARGIGGSNNDEAKAIAMAPDGGVCLTGYFTGTVDFDPGASTVNLVSAGNSDVFVLKLDASGNLAWARNMGGTADDYGLSIAVDRSGNTFTTGYFAGTADFNPSVGVSNLVSLGSADAFVSKLDAAGNFLWAKGIGGTSADYGYGIALDADGNAYTTGTFQGTVDFDPGAGLSTITSAGGYDVFVSKLDASGNFLWARGMGGTGSDYGYAIAVDRIGNVYTTGYFQLTADFDPGTSAFNLTSAGGNDIFAWELDSAGNFVLAANLGGSYSDYGSSNEFGFGIVPTSDGGILLTGMFYGPADFDPRASAFTLQSNNYSVDIFIAKLLPDHAPVDLGLSNVLINAPVKPAEIVGQLTALDPDANENFTYEMLDSAGGRFMLTDSFVRVANPTLIDPTASYDIVIRVRDSFGFACNKTLTITIADVPACTLGNRVWNDLNGNGIQDVGEPGMAGAVIDIFQSFDATVGNADDVSFGEAVTDVAGNYLLTNLPAGSNYYLRVRPPVGYTFTAQDAGSDDVLDSDVNASGVTSLFALSAGANQTGIAAGLTGAVPNFGYAFQVGSSNSTVEYGQAITLDAAGNTYIAGYFNGTIDFDPGPGVYNLTSATSTYADIFIAKYSNAGALCWAGKMGGATNDYGYGVAVDASGNAYCTGYFTATADFDPGPATFNLTSAAGNTDIFVVKFDPNGNFLWAKGFGGTSDDIGRAVAVGTDGSVYATGSFILAADFDPSAQTSTLTSAGGQDVFVVKLDSSGNFLWARNMGGTGNDCGYGIAVSSDGIYTTGAFSGTADFNPSADTANLVSLGSLDIFVSKLDSAGNFAWARAAGGSIASDNGYGIALSSDGSVYITGSFAGTVDFDPGAGVCNLVSAGSYDIFVWKLNTAGDLVWARNMGGTRDDVGYAIAVDPLGNAYTSGYFQGTADFVPGDAKFNLVGSGNSYDCFIAELSSTGDFAAAVGIGSSMAEYGYGIAVSSLGDIYATGFAGAWTDFDPRGGTWIAANVGGLFIWKLTANRAPTSIALSNISVPAHSLRGSVVGALSASDPDSNEVFTYELLDSAGGRFMLYGSLLRVDNAALIDHPANYDIKVRVRDSLGTAYEKVFTICVTGDPGCAIGDLVWTDLNGNGIQDPGEPGIAGAVVQVWQSTDGTIGNSDDFFFMQTVSDAAGNYAVGGLVEGSNYYLVFRSPAGYAFTVQDAGGNNTLDSDANPSGVSSFFALEANAVCTDLDAGLVGVAAPFGFAFNLGNTTANQTVQKFAVDYAGNMYFAAYFQGTVDFDPGPGVYNVASSGTSSNAIIAKYSSAGALLWTRVVGITSINSMVAAPDGSVYLTGYYSSSVDYDPGPGVINLGYAGGNADLYLSKIDALGNIAWVNGIGGTGYDLGRGLAIAQDGNVILTGSFQSTVDFDPGAGIANLTSAGYSEIFIGKYSPAGALVWIDQIGGASSDDGYDVAVSPDGNICATGIFSGTVDFDPGAGVANLTCGSYGNVFIVKLDTAGKYLWAKNYGGTGNISPFGISVGPDGGPVTCGYFYNTMDFDPGSGVYKLTAPGSSMSYFIAKLDGSGNFAWAHAMTFYIKDVAVAVDNSVFAAGSYTGTVDFDLSDDAVFNLYNKGGYLWKLDPAGNFAMAAGYGGSTVSVAGLDLFPDGSAGVAGSFSGVVDFDPRGGTLLLDSGSYSDIFGFKLLPDAAPTDAALARETIPLTSRTGTIVGQLFGSDPDPNELFSYRIVDSAGGRFTVDSPLVRLANAALLEPGGVYNIVVQVLDSLGTATNKSLSITVSDAPTSSIGNSVWNDLNGNGVQDAGEPGVAGAVIELRQSMDGTIGNADDYYFGQTTSDAAGNYRFDGLLPDGSYYITVRPPAAYVFGTQDAGGDDTLDSDVNGTGMSGLFSIVADSARTDIDVGLVGTAPPFGFAFACNGKTNTIARAITTDAQGNVYITGALNNTVDFDPGPADYNLTSATSLYANVFVAKYTNSGALCWARSFPGVSSSDEFGYAIAVDSSGNVYTTGSFIGTVDFDPGTKTFNLTGSGSNDVFISKLNAEGNFVWARSVGGSGADVGNALALAADGVYVTGSFAATGDFDPGSGTYNLVNAGNTDVFLLKLDLAGNFAWARGFGGTSNDAGNAITVSSDGYAYAIGNFSYSADFDPGPSTSNLTSAGSNDVFVSKFDSVGNFIWARSMGGTGYDVGTAIALSPDGSICTTGYFQGTADFDPGTAIASLRSAGGNDVFVSKLSADGGFIWARGMGGANDDSATGIAVSSTGNIYTTGSFNLRADFDPSSASIFTLTNASPYNTYPDIFLSNLDAAGNFVSAARVGGASNDYCYALVLDVGGSVYMAGGTGGADFDPRGGQYNLNPNGWGLFVAKWFADQSPTNANLSSATVAPHSPYGTVVGELFVSDPDPQETFTYELLDSAGGRFALTDSLLRVASGDLLETGNSYTIVVRIRDSFGLSYDKTLTITVGETTPRSSLAGVVWNDLNGNGLQDPGEPGVAGAVVEAFRSLDSVADYADDVSWSETLTDAAGSYRLDGLMAGVNYYLVFRPPVGYSFTLPNVGSNDAQDSDANSLGATSLLVLSPGEIRTDIAAGLTGVAPAFGMAFGIQTSSALRSQLTATDATGNVYVVERYNFGLTDIDPGPRVVGADPTAGSAFVAKYTSTGAFCWGHTFYLDINGLAIAPDGGILLDGSFMGIADCDPAAGTHNISAYNRSLFFLKLDAAGNFLWVRQMGGDSGSGDLSTIALDASGNIYATGNISGTIDIDPGPATQNITNSGTNGNLILELDASGGYLWSRQITCSSTCTINDIVIGPDGSLSMTGAFYGTADFDPGPAAYNLTSSGLSDIFVLKLDSSRNFAWAYRLGGSHAGYVQEGIGPTSDEQGTGIAVDAAGSIYLTGRFVGTADFDPGPGVCNLTSSNSLAHPDPYNNTEYSDIFVAKLTALGSFVWASNFGGGLYESGTSIAVDPNGGVFVAGSVRGAADFDPSSDQFAVNLSGGMSTFIAKLNSDGSLGWAASAASSSGCNIDVSSDGSVYATSNFYGVVDFDPRPGTFNIGVASTTEMFVWKLNPDQPPTTVSLSSNTVSEHGRRGLVVGRLSASDGDSDEAFTYELLDTAGGRFMLTGSFLQVDNCSLLDFSHGPYQVRVRVRDSLGALCDKVFMIAVTQQPLCSVGDRVWNDLNGNGVQDVGEPGLPGVVVEVFQAFNGVIGDSDDLSLGQTATDANGNYSMAGLNAGDGYYLVFRAPVGCAFTLADAAGNDTLDSDVNSVGITAIFSLAAGDARSDLDAGLTGAIPNFGFAIGPTYVYNSSVTSTAVDAAGNVYVIGYFQQTADFDPGPGVYNLTSTLTDGNIFVAKYSQTGSLYWARSFARKCDIGMALGTDGSVYVNGTFSSTMDFDPGPNAFNVLTTVPSVFVVKLDTMGAFDWVRTIGQTDIITLKVSAIATDSNNNVYTSGVFSGRAFDFDPGPNEVSIISINQDIYVWKLDSQGNFVWARDFQVASVSAMYSRSMSVSPDGGVHVAGYFSGTVDFDPGAATYSITSAGAYDSFVVKLNSAGNFLWADRIGGTGDERNYAMAVASDNSVYMDAGGIMKLDSLGHTLWTRSAGSLINRLAVSANGSVCATGNFTGTVDFDPGSGVFNLSSTRSTAYVWILTSDGNFVSAFGAAGGTNASSSGYAIAAGFDGSIYATGTCSGTTDFDPGTGTFNLTSSMFLWKLRANHVPLADAGGPYTINEGQSLVLSGAASTDPDAAAGDYIVSYQWDIGADGSYEYSGVSTAISWAQLIGLPLNTAIPLQLRVTDRSGATSVAMTTLRLTCPPPQVANVLLDDDTAQRSMITQVTVAFSTLVTVDEGAFEVVRTGAGGGSVVVAATIAEVNGCTVATLRFSGTQTEFNSLADGNYQLIVHGGKIHDSLSGLALDGDADGQAGGDFVFGDRLFDGFFRFFGDSDGDRDVDNLDFARLRNSYNRQVGDPAYLVCFDSNADGSVDAADFALFRRNYLTRLAADLPTGSPADLTLTVGDDGLTHIYQTGTTIDATLPRMSAAASLGGIPGQLLLCDTLTVDFSRGDPLNQNGVSFSGNALRIVGTAAEDDVTMTAAEITVNGSAPLYYANASDFAFDLGGGDNSLTLDQVTLTLQEDNAISAGTRMTVAGGMLDFNGHVTQIGDLLVKEGGQVLGNSIQNGTTAILSGILTVSSIACDTLTIGGGQQVAATGMVPNTRKDAALPTAEAPEVVTADAENRPIVAVPLVGKTAAIRTETPSSLTAPQSSIPAVATLPKTAWLSIATVADAVAAAESVSAAPWQEPMAMLDAKTSSAYFSPSQGLSSGRLYLITQRAMCVAPLSRSASSFFTQSKKETVAGKPADSSSEMTRPTSRNLVANHDLRQLALESYLSEFQTHPAIAEAVTEAEYKSLIENHARTPGRLFAKAIDEFYLKEINEMDK